MANSWWSTHARVGATSALPPAATFTVHDFYFDLDNNPATLDTAKILVGQSVQWQWVNGIHTITNGTGSGDPNEGLIFDQPSESSSPQFTFTFNSAGTFPFFCRFHEIDGMFGTVVVKSAAGVEPGPGPSLGFTSGPTPNPSAAGARFGFALSQPGPALAEVYDVRGRLVAIVLDRSLPVGPHEAAWDGRSQTGSLARAGIYYVRLRLPGFAGSRRLAIAR